MVTLLKLPVAGKPSAGALRGGWLPARTVAVVIVPHTAMSSSRRHLASAEAAAASLAAHDPRCFPNTMPNNTPLTAAEEQEVLGAAGSVLKHVKQAAKAHQDIAGGSIYIGTAGVALMYHHMGQQLRRGVQYPHGVAYLNKHTPQTTMQLAAEFLVDAERVLPRRRVTFLEGYSGALALQAALQKEAGDVQAATQTLQELHAYGGQEVAALKAGECELLYGRAGYLYALLWTQQQCGPDSVDRGMLQGLVAHLLNEGRRGAAARGLPHWGLMYSWHGTEYLGAAHGLCGILYVLLHCMDLVSEVDPGGNSYRAVQAALDSLVASCFPSGNLPSSLGNTEDRLVQWCHGAAGFIVTMCKAHQVIGANGIYLAAAERAAECLWYRGLLKKGVGLCHGISGNGFAFLSLFRASKEQRYLYRAQQFALFAARRWKQLYHVPDSPASLYEGAAGAVCFWLSLADPGKSVWPGAEL